MVNMASGDNGLCSTATRTAVQTLLPISAEFSPNTITLELIVGVQYEVDRLAAGFHPTSI